MLAIQVLDMARILTTLCSNAIPFLRAVAPRLLKKRDAPERVIRERVGSNLHSDSELKGELPQKN
jgi:hypothetical protein